MVYLWILIWLSDLLGQPERDRRDFVVRQVFVPGHICSVNAEFNDPCNVNSLLGTILCKREMKVRSDRKIGGKALEVTCPARFTACVVAGGAGSMKEPLSITGIRRCNGGRRWLPVILL